MIISTLITTSAAEISEAVSATPDEVETQPTEGYCDGFYYTVLEDGTAEITNYDGKETDLIIPEEVNGIAVTKIEALWDYPFYETNIRHIFIGKNITYINTGNGNLNCLGELQAFSVDLNNEYYCSIDGVLFNKDKSILLSYPCAKEGEIYNIPESVKEIGAHCFSSNRNLTDLDIPDNVTFLGWEAVSRCYNLKNLHFGNGITEIGFIFEFCNKLENVTFGNCLQYFRFDNLYGTSIKNLYFPESVNQLYDYDIDVDDIEKLENVFINNDKYYDINGVLYSREKNKLLIYPNSKKTEQYFVPEGITELFAISNDYIRELYISSTVTEIGEIDSNLLENINVSENNPAFYSINGILFSKKTNELLIYPKCNKTESLIIPEGIIKTCDINSTALKTLNIPSTVTQLGKITCNSLENINVNEQNKNYCSIDGVLYNKEVTDLIHFPLASQITELLVPDTVTTISARIEITKHLKNITLGKNVKNFSGYAFTMHGELIENIFVDEDNPNFYSKNGVLYSKITNDVVAYPQNNRTKTFEIPEGTELIFSAIFLRDCKYLENVVIPESLTAYVTLGLCYCPNLKNIYVSNDNPAFCDIDGILYSKDRKTLLYYPRGRKEPTYNIYKNTETIGSSSFWGNTYLTNITIPDNVKKIDVGAFFNCENLKEITLPKNIVELSGIGWSCSDPGGHGEYIKYDDITIKGYSGTVAETYAKENGFTFISLGNVEKTLGDVNGDGVISILDATEIQKYLASISELNNNQISVADVNKDGVISIVDATEIQKFIAELPSVIKKS